MLKWCEDIEARVRAKTARPLRIRSRTSTRSLAADFRDCWAVVTHSSNIAVDAVIGGLPAFVEPTAATAPLGDLHLKNLDHPTLASRQEIDAWWASLMCQQFTIREMATGVAYQYLSAVMDQ
jgi:hypothetical protein